MQKYGLNELREMYLKYFESKGHLRMPSFSLIPENDPSLMLINSGMAPLKPYFTGAAKPPKNRVTTCQKCVRTPDIENVGITSRHGTYFEMLGNFSFGDYFKNDAIKWAWEFISEHVGLPVEKLYATVYMDDDEAYDIWKKVVGLPESKIKRLGKKDNFWEHGTGPCGPSSEIYFDRGAENGCGAPDCAPGCDCDRYVEFWNLVFTQFNKDEKDNYTPLKSKNIDTGMGLERLACVVQGVSNLFEVDTIRKILDMVCTMSGKRYNEDHKTDISIRVITDHIRSTVMMISDGVLPSNENRGYVLRRLLRRAARHGRLMGITKPFLFDLSATVINESKAAYPELQSKSDYIRKIIRIEEEKFLATIDQGLAIMDAYVAEMKTKGDSVIKGAFAFKMHDTYGFPLDLSREIALENGLELDEEGFFAEMNIQKEMAREATRAKGGSAWKEDALPAMGSEITDFTGYESLSVEAKVIYIISGGELTGSITEGDRAQIVLDRSPLYAESGGQAADKGYIRTTGDGIFIVEDVKKLPDGKTIHDGYVSEGELRAGETVKAEVDAERRVAVARNHSATHLLQKALRNVLGEHVHQAGSFVNEDRIRFDFLHFAPLTDIELLAVEDEVNTKMLDNLDISCVEMPIEEARKLNAMALFGEKYGDRVRVVRMGDYSLEFCGGTHLKSTASAGLFKITSENGVAAGVRRIEAVTGKTALEYIRKNENLLNSITAALKTEPKNGVRKIGQIASDLKTAQKEIERLQNKLITETLENIAKTAENYKGVKIATAKFDGMEADALRNTADRLKGMLDPAVIVLASVTDGKVMFIVAATQKAIDMGADAGKVVKEAAQAAGGGGGGRKDMAQAGGKDVSKTAEALAKAAQTAKDLIK